MVMNIYFLIDKIYMQLAFLFIFIFWNGLFKLYTYFLA
jgi:hypothetical protein